MKKEPLIVFISILFLLVSCRVKDENIESAIFSPVNYVDPYIGTGGHGHTVLGVAAPFGAVQIGPNNINKAWLLHCFNARYWHTQMRKQARPRYDKA